MADKSDFQYGLEKNWWLLKQDLRFSCSQCGWIDFPIIPSLSHKGNTWVKLGCRSGQNRCRLWHDFVFEFLCSSFVFGILGALACLVWDLDLRSVVSGMTEASERVNHLLFVIGTGLVCSIAGAVFGFVISLWITRNNF